MWDIGKMQYAISRLSPAVVITETYVKEELLSGCNFEWWWLGAQLPVSCVRINERIVKNKYTCTYIDLCGGKPLIFWDYLLL